MTWFARRHRNVLNMTFDDITSPEKWQLLSQFGNSRHSDDSSGNASAEKDYVLFDQDMAREIADFVDANHEARTWIVHCSAGISRSGAVSLWLKDWLKFKYGIDAVNVDGKYAIPNSHVLSELNRMFY